MRLSLAKRDYVTAIQYGVQLTQRQPALARSWTALADAYVADGQFDNLEEGQQVEYSVEQGSGPKGKGPRAASVAPA